MHSTYSPSPAAAAATTTTTVFTPLKRRNQDPRRLNNITQNRRKCHQWITRSPKQLNKSKFSNNFTLHFCRGAHFQKEADTISDETISKLVDLTRSIRKQQRLLQKWNPTQKKPTKKKLQWVQW
jgi:hypothetical protein